MEKCFSFICSSSQFYSFQVKLFFYHSFIKIVQKYNGIPFNSGQCYSFSSSQMKSLTNYPIQELKLIYTLLHTQWPHTELLNSQLLQDLQAHLIQQAILDGIDISQHQDWSHWLRMNTK